ncbi:uncharacterized protein P174DRAFT_447744 [Aspergillus novofumigatus IBT 16806]|uniref:Uncharacterized protein n=1 Tax=Aspergillus novofumigatus (strain IBT 16806) TaxID=1392255 RepID=A0A2I1CNN1_ASPN1|nr:uncharacterized protein P174DRAFT_447744 [Aspergillus novofumigatus IBT 16806]PKX99212.1 hypothetical protein P174DRAFT_447744 [Aspergillus novofumigatus IBT 16806]
MTQQVACTTPIAQTKASFPASLIISNHRNFKGSTLLDSGLRLSPSTYLLASIPHRNHSTYQVELRATFFGDTKSGDQPSRSSVLSCVLLTALISAHYASCPTSGDFPGISLEYIVGRENRIASHDLDTTDGSVLPSPAEVVKALTRRADAAKTYVPAFVLGGIWFFFWAKNGGFVWRKGDWDEYKSTVLRRKGPDGRTLSNATKSTRLGGGSIVGKGYSDDGYTVADGYTDTATTITEKEEGDHKRKRRFRETAKQKLMRRRKDENWEGEADEDVRAYRKEKPARIGGINCEGDGTYHGSDYDTSNPPTSYNASEMSEVRDYAYEPARQGRNFSFTPGSEDVLSQTAEERQHLREPSARRHNRRRERRRAPPTTSSRQGSPRKRDHQSVPGHYTEPLDFSSAGSRSEYQYSNVETDDGSGTKHYHHPIPGLSKGYRREGGRSRRRDSLSDSDGDETRYS